MSTVKMTVKQILDLGLWDKVCEYKDWSPWILNEGQIGEDELVEFDSEFKKEPEYSDTENFKRDIRNIIKQLEEIEGKVHSHNEMRIASAIQELEYLI